VRRLSAQIELEQSFGQRDDAGWEARLTDLVRDRGFSRTRKGSGYKFGKDVTRTECSPRGMRCLRELQTFKRDADADLAAVLQRNSPAPPSGIRRSRSRPARSISRTCLRGRAT
jgi:hypothetical protein